MMSLATQGAVANKGPEGMERFGATYEKEDAGVACVRAHLALRPTFGLNSSVDGRLFFCPI